MMSSYGWFSKITTTVWLGRGTAGLLAVELGDAWLVGWTPMPLGAPQAAHAKIPLLASMSHTTRLPRLMSNPGVWLICPLGARAAKQACCHALRPLSGTLPANRLALACLGELAPVVHKEAA
jgi:hypothetical protein